MFDIRKAIGCSALIVEGVRSETGQPLFGRNLDFPTSGYLQEYSLVTVYQPTGKHAFVAVTFPGLVGCLSGMNDAGLALAILEVHVARDGSTRFDKSGTPYALCYRRLLEECSTVEEAEKLLRTMKRTTRTLLAICDRNGGGVLEITPKQVLMRQAVGGVCPCTNHFVSKELSPLVELNLFRTRERYRELEKRAELVEKFDVPTVNKALDAANMDDWTLQTMVFEPATLRLHVALGKCPSSALPLRLLELAPLLGPQRAK
jgi:predicted choloylglycine hydrolase